MKIDALDVTAQQKALCLSAVLIETFGEGTVHQVLQCLQNHAQSVPSGKGALSGSASPMEELAIAGSGDANVIHIHP